MSKGVQQDSLIFDDDEEETCPLCVEEFDLTDKGFKPCPCGYQVRLPRAAHLPSCATVLTTRRRSVSSATTMSRTT